MIAAAVLFGYMLTAMVLAGGLLGHTPRAVVTAARVGRNWLPLGGRRCPDCGRKNPGKDHDCSHAPGPALRVPSWARKDQP